MSPRLRKTMLLAHVGFSVGWLGAAAAFLAIAVVALTSPDEVTVRGAYLVMEKAAWGALVPLAVASLVTGLVQSLATPWGLFRHYWVVFKLVLTAVATGMLLLYMQTFQSLAEVAADPGADLQEVRSLSPALHAAGGLLVLLAALALGIYKPRGLTRYGWSKKHQQPPAAEG